MIASSFPIHFAQKKRVRALPKIGITTKTRPNGASIKRLDRRPLGDQHTKRCEEHAGDPDHHHRGNSGHSDNQAVHVLDIPALDPVLDRAHGKEHERLWNRMEDDKEGIAAHIASAVPIPHGNDKPEVCNSGVGEHPFAFVWEMAIPEAIRKVNAPTNARV